MEGLTFETLKKATSKITWKRQVSAMIVNQKMYDVLCAELEARTSASSRMGTITGLTLSGLHVMVNNLYPDYITGYDYPDKLVLHDSRTDKFHTMDKKLCCKLWNCEFDEAKKIFIMKGK